jgi:hypothetical protein
MNAEQQRREHLRDPESDIHGVQRVDYRTYSALNVSKRA